MAGVVGRGLFHSIRFSPCDIKQSKFIHGLWKISSGKRQSRSQISVSRARVFNDDWDGDLSAEQFHSPARLAADCEQVFQECEDDISISPEWPCLENAKDVLRWRMNEYHKKCKQEEESAKDGNGSNRNFYWEFGCYLDRVWMQPALAQKYYEKALHVEPHNAGLMIDYAFLVWKGLKNIGKASQILERAVQEFGDDVEVLGSYASFLWETDDG